MAYTRLLHNSYSAQNQISGTHAQIGARVLSYRPAKFVPEKQSATIVHDRTNDRGFVVGYIDPRELSRT